MKTPFHVEVCSLSQILEPSNEKYIKSEKRINLTDLMSATVTAGNTNKRILAIV